MEERPDKGRGIEAKGYEGHWRRGKDDGAEGRKKWLAMRGKEGSENGTRRRDRSRVVVRRL